MTNDDSCRPMSNNRYKEGKEWNVGRYQSHHRKGSKNDGGFDLGGRERRHLIHRSRRCPLKRKNAPSPSMADEDECLSQNSMNKQQQQQQQQQQQKWKKSTYREINDSFFSWSRSQSPSRFSTLPPSGHHHWDGTTITKRRKKEETVMFCPSSYSHKYL